MGYYYHDDDDEFNNSHRSFSLPVVVTTAAVSGVILIILLIVLATNNTNSGKNNLKNTQMKAKLNEADATPGISYDLERNGNESIDELYKEGKLRAEDLDFWNMYGNETFDYTVSTPAPVDGEDEDDPSATADPSSTATPDVTPTGSPDPADELIEGVKENNVDFTKLQVIDNKMSYLQNGEKVSKLGVMISQDNGVVDFNTLKDNGIDFVMIKVGQRGYDSGVIKPDTNFERNIKAADEADMPMGLYFCSRAVTEKEAKEEADYCTSAAYSYSVKYPIAFVFEGELIDDSRTDILEKDDKTKMAVSFMDQVRFEGYTPILFGSEDYLLNQIEPEKILKDTDVMLNEQSLLPTYPYQFKMWRYILNQTVPGIERGGDYIISFADYAGR